MALYFLEKFLEVLVRKLLGLLALKKGIIQLRILENPG